MISPTGRGIRNDSEGQGHYGASRKKTFRGKTIHYTHKGTDYLATEGQEIVAPFDMLLERYSKPSIKFPRESGIKWSTHQGNGKMFYFEPNLIHIGSIVPQGMVIGIAMDLKPYYGSKISNHIHFQIDSFNPEFIRSLTTVLNMGM